MATPGTNFLGALRSTAMLAPGLPLVVLAMLAMIVLPMPPLVLDALFTFNICISLVVILAVVYVISPLDLAAFPTVLLLATLLRLALNVASTRVVLLHGHTGTDSAGKVIEALVRLDQEQRCELLYFDESGFSPNPPVQHGWFRPPQPAHCRLAWHTSPG